MKENQRKSVEMLAGVLAGNAVLAFGVAAFVVPKGMIMGGATGIGLTLSHYLHLPLSLSILAVNGAVFILGAIVLGKRFALTTMLSSFVYPLFLSVMQAMPGISAWTDNMMLSTIYGGALLGLGIGLVVRVGASTGGTDTLALVVHRWTHIPVAALLYMIDFAVLGCQMFFSDSEQILYGILILAFTSFILNRVMLLGKSQIQLFVVTDRYREMREKMLKTIDVGVTMVHIETGYGGKQQKGVLCIIPKRKLYAVTEQIQKIDSRAFITITQINEVRGQGFTLERTRYEERNREGNA